jgi:hypothetical protein
VPTPPAAAWIQDDLPGRKGGVIEQRLPGRQSRERNRGGLRIVETFGLWSEIRRLNGDIVSCGAVAREIRQSKYRITCFHRRHMRSDSLHNT